MIQKKGDTPRRLVQIQFRLEAATTSDHVQVMGDSTCMRSNVQIEARPDSVASL